MRFIKFFGENGYCGCDFEQYEKYEDDMPDDVLDEIAADLVQENAESFEHAATGWGNDFESEEDREFYYENASGGWEEVAEEEYNENV